MLPLTKRRKVGSATECKLEQITNLAFVSESNSEIKNDLMDVTFGQPIESETIIYEGTKAHNMSNSEGPRKKHDVKVNNNN